MRPFGSAPEEDDAPIGILPAAIAVSLHTGVPGPGSVPFEVADEALPLRLVVPLCSDLLTPFQEVVPGPVGGRLTIFVQIWRSVMSVAFTFSRNPRFSMNPHQEFQEY